MGTGTQRVRFGGGAGRISAALVLLLTLFALSMMVVLYLVSPKVRDTQREARPEQAELLSVSDADRYLAGLLRDTPMPEPPAQETAPPPEPAVKETEAETHEPEPEAHADLEVNEDEQESDMLEELRAYNEELREERRRRTAAFDAEVARLRAGEQSAMNLEQAAHEAPTSIALNPDGSVRSGADSAAAAKVVSGSAASQAAGGTQGLRAGTLDSYAVLEQNTPVSPHKVEKPKSRYYLRQGSVIPAVLISGINSDLPGQISAQVTRNVYDSPTGQHLLIPSGTLLVGQYMSGTVYGQERVFSGFTRLLFPDGKSLNLGAMPAQATDGYAGFDADVDNHYFKLLMASFFVAGFATADAVSAGGAYDSEGNVRPGEMLGRQYGLRTGKAAENIAERSLNISPTLKVRPGTLFSVAVTKDLYFDGV